MAFGQLATFCVVPIVIGFHTEDGIADLMVVADLAADVISTEIGVVIFPLG
ncbi:MAG: hypothetical protein R3D67_01470 [Hyphomicrobiaceae bacterium]